VQVVCRQDKSVEEFIAELALHRLDVVIADGPAGPRLPVRAFSPHLGECGTTFFATAKLALSARRRFPQSLDGAPFLMPGASSTVRRTLEQWFASQGIRPRVVAEFDDSALAKDFAQAGLGLFAAPTIIEAELRRQYNLRVVGRVPTVRHQFFAISVERKIRHPAAAAICEAARKDVFARTEPGEATPRRTTQRR
jgi:LysR family transcriptional activator of nhaA